MAPLNSLPSLSGPAQSCQQHTGSTQQHSLALCTLKESCVPPQNLGTKLSRAQPHPGSPHVCKKQDVPMQINVLQNKGTEQNCGLQHKLIQNIIFKNNRSHHTPWSLNIRLDQSLSYRICAFRPKKNPTTRKQNSSKVTYKTNLYKL